MIIALRTDTSETLLVLLEPDGSELGRDRWESGRRLSGELLPHIEQLLHQHSAGWTELRGVVVYRGPGSFTGLRIGCSVANAIAYGQNIPVVGPKGDSWIELGLQRLQKGNNDTQVVPYYGRPPNISKPRGTA